MYFFACDENSGFILQDTCILKILPQASKLPWQDEWLCNKHIPAVLKFSGTDQQLSHTAYIYY